MTSSGHIFSLCRASAVVWLAFAWLQRQQWINLILAAADLPHITPSCCRCRCCCRCSCWLNTFELVPRPLAAVTRVVYVIFPPALRHSLSFSLSPRLLRLSRTECIITAFWFWWRRHHRRLICKLCLVHRDFAGDLLAFIVHITLRDIRRAQALVVAFHLAQPCDWRESRREQGCWSGSFADFRWLRK